MPMGSQKTDQPGRPQARGKLGQTDPLTPATGSMAGAAEHSTVTLGLTRELAVHPRGSTNEEGEGGDPP